MPCKSPNFSRRSFLRSPLSSESLRETAHISSLLALCRPEHLGTVSARITAIPEAEVMATEARGKLVIVLETANDTDITRITDQIMALDGVLAVNLVYHEIDTAGLENPVEASGPATTRQEI